MAFVLRLYHLDECCMNVILGDGHYFVDYESDHFEVVILEVRM